MAKRDWIRAQYATFTPQNVALFTSAMNTQTMVTNPSPLTNVPKPISILAVAENLLPNDRRLLQNEGAYKSLIDNVVKGDLISAQADIQNLATTPQISPAAIAILQGALAASTLTEPDPNRPPLILASPAQLAGHGLILCDEVEALL